MEKVNKEIVGNLDNDLEKDIEIILKENLTFPDIKKVDPSYYKNNVYKIKAAEESRQNAINIKVKGLVSIIVSKIKYGTSYSEKTEKYLSEIIYPLLIKVYSGKDLKVNSEIKPDPSLYIDNIEE